MEAVVLTRYVEAFLKSPGRTRHPQNPLPTKKELINNNPNTRQLPEGSQRRNPINLIQVKKNKE
jgi:hypothetical protein